MKPSCRANLHRECVNVWVKGYISLKAITDGHLAKIMEHRLESVSENPWRFLQLSAH